MDEVHDFQFNIFDILMDDENNLNEDKRYQLFLSAICNSFYL